MVRFFVPKAAELYIFEQRFLLAIAFRPSPVSSLLQGGSGWRVGNVMLSWTLTQNAGEGQLPPPGRGQEALFGFLRVLWHFYCGISPSHRW